MSGIDVQDQGSAFMQGGDEDEWLARVGRLGCARWQQQRRCVGATRVSAWQIIISRALRARGENLRCGRKSFGGVTGSDRGRFGWDGRLSFSVLRTCIMNESEPILGYSIYIDYTSYSTTTDTVYSTCTLDTSYLYSREDAVAD